MENQLDKLKPTERFTNRVDNYTRYRPGYPAEIAAILQDKLPPATDTVIADAGSGTGIFSELLLKCGYTVYGVEPNKAMRDEAERRLSVYPLFKSVAGMAEQTTLPANSVDLVTVAQAFHWFDAEAAKSEFSRILKYNGAVALLWNIRVNASPQMIEYEQLKSGFGTDYRVTKRADENNIKRFFNGGTLSIYTFPNNQLLDFAALKGQLLSASYIPTEGHPRYAEMIKALEDIFGRYNKDGFIEIVQETRMYINR